MSGLGRMSLRDYCGRYGIDLEYVACLLPERISADPDRKLRDLAEELGTDPEGVIGLLNDRAGGAKPPGEGG